MTIQNLFGKPLVAILAVALAACSTNNATPTPAAGRGGNNARQAAEPTAIPTRVVTAQTVITVDGGISLGTPALSLGFDATGMIRSVKTSIGQIVHAGDVLATVDDTALQDAVTDATVALNTLQATINQQNTPSTREDIAAAEAALNNTYVSYNTVKTGSTATDIEASRKNLESAKLGLMTAQVSRDLACSGPDGLSKISCKQAEASLGNAYEGWISSQDSLQKLLAPPAQDLLIQANSSIVSARAKLEALKSGVIDTQRKINETQIAQASAAVQRAKDNVASTQLRSPCDCIVQEVNVAVGMAAGSSAFTLVNLSALQFKTTNVTERDIAKLKPGAITNIRLKAHGEPLTARLGSVLAQASGAQGNTATYTVLFDLDKTDKLLLPGMTGQADISVSS